MRARNLLIIIALNTLLIILTSYIMEYFSLTEKLQSISSIVSTAADTAIQTSVKSDDFFVSGVHYGVSGTDASGSNNTTASNLTVWSDTYGGFMSTNLLQAVMYYKTNVQFPTSPLIPPSQGMNTLEDMYNWCYTNNSFFNNTFRPFVASSITRKVMIRDSSNTAVEKDNIPVLDQMGYGVTNPELLNDVRFTNIWKTGYGVSYLYTPSSLGVTYINPDILVPVLKSNLELLMRLKHSNPADGTGCIPAFWGRSHDVGSGEKIINNGVFELDLNSITADIEYKVINMFDATNDGVLKYLFGAGHIGYASKAAQLQALSTGSTNGNIIVAKVVVNMNLHIPYQSPWMQEGRFAFAPDNDGNNHFDVVDTSTGTNNGVGYTYQTYFTVAQ